MTHGKLAQAEHVVREHTIRLCVTSDGGCYTLDVDGQTAGVFREPKQAIEFAGALLLAKYKASTRESRMETRDDDR